MTTAGDTKLPPTRVDDCTIPMSKPRRLDGDTANTRAVTGCAEDPASTPPSPRSDTNHHQDPPTTEAAPARQPACERDPKYAMYGEQIHIPGRGHGAMMIGAPDGVELPPFWGTRTT